MAVPFIGNITDLKEISKEKKEWHSTALGMLGWVSSTVRLDVRHCHSRIAQYTASPCQGSYDALVLVCRYLISTPNLCLRQPLREPGEWRFFCDSDMGSNPEPGNRRRSQLGYIALWGWAPMVWSSKVTSVGFTLDALPAGFVSQLPPVTRRSTLLLPVLKLKFTHLRCLRTKSSLSATRLRRRVSNSLSRLLFKSTTRRP
jgi:hypothetical protein